LVGYHWLRGTTAVIYENNRVPVPRPVLPGSSFTTPVTVYTALSPGAYTLQFDLVENNITWFSAAGASTENVPVVVTAPAYAARWSSFGLPKSLHPSEAVIADTKVVNTGVDRWITEAQGPVRLEYSWSRNGFVDASMPAYEVPVPALAPGQAGIVGTRLVTPPEAATYVLTLNLLEPDGQVFPKATAPLVESVTVAAPSAIAVSPPASFSIQGVARATPDHSEFWRQFFIADVLAAVCWLAVVGRARAFSRRKRVARTPT
jgi:hypothetical protein